MSDAKLARAFQVKENKSVIAKIRKQLSILTTDTFLQKAKELIELELLLANNIRQYIQGKKLQTRSIIKMLMENAPNEMLGISPTAAAFVAASARVSTTGALGTLFPIIIPITLVSVATSLKVPKLNNL